MRTLTATTLSLTPGKASRLDYYYCCCAQQQRTEMHTTHTQQTYGMPSYMYTGS